MKYQVIQMGARWAIATADGRLIAVTQTHQEALALVQRAEAKSDDHAHDHGDDRQKPR